jgi:hypothetical protein
MNCRCGSSGRMHVCKGETLSSNPSPTKRKKKLTILVWQCSGLLIWVHWSRHVNLNLKNEEEGPRVQVWLLSLPQCLQGLSIGVDTLGLA